MKGLTQLSFQTFVSLCYKAYGLDVFGMHKWLLKTMYWSPRQRLEWRLQRLGNILEFAWNHVPFYREYWGDHGVDFRRPQEMEELQRYPILPKDVFRANAARIQPDSLSSIRHRRWHTGGTTGQPVQYLRDLEQWTLAEAFHLWGWSQLGYVFGDPVGVIAGGSLIPEGLGLESRARGWMHRRLFLYGVAMDQPLARIYYNRLQKHRVKFLYGYPSALYLFGKHLLEQGLALPSLKAVVTTAEMLLPQYREGIERTFGCRVFDNLGCNDGGYESYECNQHKGFHYNDLQSVLELNHVKTSGEGCLIITNLWNKSNPFIRYENGDMITLASQPCPCTSPFPLISSVQGKTHDILTFANGRALTGPALALIFREMAIDGWQVVQTSTNRLEIRMCSSSELKPEYVDHVYNVLRHYLTEEVEISVRKVEKLEATKGGKLKSIWTEV